MGEHLSVEQLTKSYQTSKTPIREALKLLHAHQLVDIIPRVGYFTSQPTVKDVQDMFDVRLILESGSARLAARRIRQQDLATLEEMHATYVPGDASTYLPWIQYNREFHCMIAQATGNAELARMIGHVVDRLQRAQWLRLDLPPSPQNAMAGHRRIVEALRRKDAEVAEAAMIADIAAARDAALSKIVESPGEWDI